MISSVKMLRESALAAIHVHSHFSLLRGVESIDWLVAWAKRAGYWAIGLADVDAMYGAVPFYAAAKAAGLHPILGVELTCGMGASPMAEGRATGKMPVLRVTLLARDREGYRNLCRLVSRRQLEPERFDAAGLVDAVVERSEGLFVLCDQPMLLGRLAKRLPAGSLYAELPACDKTSPAARARLRAIYAAAIEHRVPVVATLDSYFAAMGGTPKQPDRLGVSVDAPPSVQPLGGATQSCANSGIDHYTLHRIVTDIRMRSLGRSAEPIDVAGDGYQPIERHHRTADELRESFAACPAALANGNHIARQCRDDVLELGTFHFPVSRVPAGETSFSHLHRLCVRGMRKRYRPVRPDVVSRLAHELSVIDKLHFSDYFLFVNEIVAFARRQGIPVDVRGSAAGSLVAAVLGFTKVCPIADDLYFERFLHAGRTDCPDIDIDLCWRRRDEVIDFCYTRWGADRVAMIATHNTMRARSALIEVAKSSGLATREAFAISRHVPEGIAGYLQRDWRELAEARRNLPLDDPRFRRMLELAGQLEGAPRNLSIHCGGLVISPGPLTDYLPLQRAAKGIVITQYEMNAVEAIGLVKLDLLGNRALSEIGDWASGIGHWEKNTRPSNPMPNAQSPMPISLDDLDPCDPATAALVSSGDTLGVFQAESPGMRNLCRQLRVASREDLTVALSVIRPGPAASGMKATYIARHLGAEQPTYLHPKLESLLARTHGVMVYQEDTMRVAVELAGFTPGQADMLRKAVSKKRSPERMAALREQFVERAMKFTPDLSAESAQRIWEQIAQFASYSFCRAHACVYGRIAWQTAWLKAHCPVEFYAAVFNNHMGMYPMRVHVADAIRHGVRVLPPSVNEAGHWASGGGGDWALDTGHWEKKTWASDLMPNAQSPMPIRLGLRFVRGLSDYTARRIIAGRKAGPYRTLDDLRRAARPGEPELVNLIRCGACDGLGEPGSHRGSLLAEAGMGIGHRGLGIGKQGQPLMPFPRCPMPNNQSPFPWTRPFSELERLQAEIDVLGLFLTRHPMDLIRGDWVSTDRLAEKVGCKVVVAGLLDATRTTATSNGELMRFVTLEDAAGLVECTFFPAAYQKCGHLFYHVGPFRIGGVVESDRGAVTLSADWAESLAGSSNEFALSGLFGGEDAGESGSA